VILASVLRLAHREHEALPLLRQGLSITERLVTEHSENTSYRESLALTHSELASTLLDVGRGRDARPHLERAIEIDIELLRETPGSPATLFNLGLARLILAKIERHFDQRSQARANAEKATENLRAALSRAPRMKECRGLSVIA